MAKKSRRQVLLAAAVLIGFGIWVACGSSGTCAAELYENCGESLSQGAGRYCNSLWSLLPPVAAILLALLTKEVYSAVFIGIFLGSLLYTNWNMGAAILYVYNEAIVGVLADPSNIGLIVFLIILGGFVCLVNRGGGSAAFGQWANAHIKTRTGAELVTVALGIVIFIDDYFNCLTVGSVMRPVTDGHHISRAKLAYLIDSTAAPVCILAPVSSWVAGVASFAEDGQGFRLFISSIPYNYYAIFTLVMVLGVILLRLDIGPMAKQEKAAAEDGDRGSERPAPEADGGAAAKPAGRTIDLIAPVAVLIAACFIGMLYSGGFFSGADLITAFSNADTSAGLVLGSAAAFAITIVYYLLRRAMKLKDMMLCLPEGVKVMAPAIIILVLSWGLETVTASLGIKTFIQTLLGRSAFDVKLFLPAVIFLVSCFLAFSTGASWTTFGILIPVVQNVFSSADAMLTISVSACLAGAVFGDHSSLLSDTSIMSSSSAQCDHMTHVSTQLPYALICAGVSIFCYVLVGVFAGAGIPGILALPVGLGVLIGILAGLHFKRAAG